MEQRLSLEAYSRSASQISCPLWNSKFPYFVHKSPPPVPISNKMIPVHNFQPCFSLRSI